jgi:hypothetical protein
MPEDVEDVVAAVLDDVVEDEEFDPDDEFAAPVQLALKPV